MLNDEIERILDEPRRAEAALADRRSQSAHLGPGLIALATKAQSRALDNAIRQAHSALSALKSEASRNSRLALQNFDPGHGGAVAYSEIRRYVCDLKPPARMVFIRERIHAGDRLLIAAVLRFPSYLSGLTDDEQATLWGELVESQPDDLQPEIDAAFAELKTLRASA